MNAVQDQAFGYIRFGNPVLDTVLLVVVTRLCTLLYENYGKGVGKWLRRVFSTEQTETICDKEFESSSGISVNDLYEAISWYFLSFAPDEHGVQIGATWKCEVECRYKMDIWYEVDLAGLVVEMNRSERHFKFRYRTTSDVFKKHMSKVLHAYREYIASETLKVTWATKIVTWSGAWNHKHLYRIIRKEDIFMRESTKTVLFDDIDRFLGLREKYEKRKMNWTRGYLLYGVPGSGKTTVVQAISQQTRMPIYKIDLDVLGTINEMNKAFSQIPPKSILLMEDVDTYKVLQRRHQEGNTENATKVVNPITLGSVLNILDGVESIHGRILIMTSNRREVLDPALLRPGRIDVAIPFENAGLEEIRQVYKKYLDLDVDPPKALDGKYSLAEICNFALGERTLESLL